MGTQEGPGLVDKQAEDTTIDHQEQSEPKEIIVIAKLLNPDEINGKTDSPDLKPPKKLDDKISRLLHGAGVSWS